MSRLSTCGACGCHVRPGEGDCAHCGAARPVGPRPPPGALIVGIGAAAAIALAPACAYGVGVTPQCEVDGGAGGAGGDGGGDPCDEGPDAGKDGG